MLANVAIKEADSVLTSSYVSSIGALVVPRDNLSCQSDTKRPRVKDLETDFLQICL